MNAPHHATPFEHVMDQLNGLPLWMKQAVFIQLKEELEAILTPVTLNTFGRTDTLQLMVPKITPLGRRELERPGATTSHAMKQFLYFTNFSKSIINICLSNRWTLEQCAILCLEAMEREWVEQPQSSIIQATLLYLANRIRIGEYLMKVGRLSVEQLDQALRTQRYIQDALGEKTGLADVMINLGYIHKQDSEGVLFLKEESRKAVKPFETLNVTGQPPTPSPAPQLSAPATAPAGVPASGPPQANVQRPQQWILGQ